jgi:shikimate kinase
MPIREYFATYGEAAFRDAEAEAIDEATAMTRVGVMATGGGVVLREANRDLLRERTTVMYLRTMPDDLARRLRNDTHRPLLQGAGDAARRLRHLFQERDPLYRRAAHFVVEAAAALGARVW